MSSLDNVVMDFQIFYQKILDAYKLKLDSEKKWNKIANIMYEENLQVVSLIRALKKQDSRTEIKINYKMSPKQLQDLITSESDMVVKSSLMIGSLHHMIYDLVSQKGNYYFLLEGRKEMQVLPKDITYYISVATKNEQNIQFHAFILLYALESMFNRHFYVGVDFEYTNKKIQLAQLNFEHNVDLRSIIMLVSPNELDKVITDNFINLIMCNTSIKKILHGSDSLDLPYVYDHLLAKDNNKIIKFTKGLIDTRFLCEYYKLSRNEVSDSKCSIYDEDPTRSAIYYFGLVSTEQQNKLTELLASMPAPHDIVWNIFKMPKSQIYYAQYDVLYLKYFYYRIMNKASQDEDSDVGKKEILELYQNVLNELAQFIFLDHREIVLLVKKCKEDVDPVNNYFIRKGNSVLKLVEIFADLSANINTVNPKVSLDKIIKVNYFKASVMTIVKRIIYGVVSRKCKIYKSKNILWTDKLDNRFIFEFFHEMGFNYLERFFRNVETVIVDRSAKVCP